MRGNRNKRAGSNSTTGAQKKRCLDGPQDVRDIAECKGVDVLKDTRQGCAYTTGEDEALDNLIHPRSADNFFKGNWEQRCLLIQRPRSREYFKALFSLQDYRELLDRKVLQYGTGLDVTRFQDGKRSNFNCNTADDGCSCDSPESAEAEAVWERFRDGCSLRILHPQRWCDALWGVMAALEDMLKCCVGCNAYLTPAASQGFAPHYDDIDAFVLQAEGAKRWRLYAPLDESGVLPRYSSRDFDVHELGPPIVDVVLQPGDLLYMPRGTIHQAVAASSQPSLHLTLSANQHRTWLDLLELALPRALQLAGEEAPALRRAVPPNFLDCMGVLHSDDPNLQEGRAALMDTATSLMSLVAAHLPLDSAADQLAAQYMRERLPPPALSFKPQQQPPLTLTTRLRACQPNIARLVLEDDVARVYHCLANQRDEHAQGSSEAAVPCSMQGSLEFDLDEAEALDVLLKLPCTLNDGARLCDMASSEEEQAALLQTAQALCNAGILVTVQECRKQSRA